MRSGSRSLTVAARICYLNRLLAHNFDRASEYGRAVAANVQLETVVPGGSLAITLKKR